MKRSVVPLDELELDALTELVNIGVGRASASLGKIIGSEIRLSVPGVEVVTRDAAASAMDERAPGEVVAVYQEFAGGLSGRAILLFPEGSSRELAHAITGTGGPHQDIPEIEQEAVQETGNIVLSNCLATIANILNRSLDISVPQVRRGNSRALLLSIAERGEGDVFLFIHINFRARKRQVSGYVALAMDVDSLTELRMLIGEYIVRASS